MTPTRVSVFIPTKNPGPLFGSVVVLLGQQPDFGYDDFIIKSGCTDGTSEYLAWLSDPRVRVPRIVPNQYDHGRTRDLGISLTAGEYCVLIANDAGTVVPPQGADLQPCDVARVSFFCEVAGKR
jgi:rhamnosyltransferase